MAAWAVAVVSAWASAPAHAQVYLTNWSGNSIGLYSPSGATINASLITGLNAPDGVAIYDNALYVSNAGNGTIGKYDLAGNTVSKSLVSGLGQPYGITVDSSGVYVANYSRGTIGKYTTDGALVSASLISGLFQPKGIAVSNGFLYVTNGSLVAKYTTGGSLVNSSLVSRSVMTGIAVQGSTLYVVDNITQSLGAYTTSGLLLNTSLVSGLANPYSVAVSGTDLYIGHETFPAIVGKYTTSGGTVSDQFYKPSGFAYGIAVAPEPGSVGVLGAVGLGLLGRRRRRAVR